MKYVLAALFVANILPWIITLPEQAAGFREGYEASGAGAWEKVPARTKLFALAFLFTFVVLFGWTDWPHAARKLARLS